MKHNEIILRNQAHPRLTATTTTAASVGISTLYVDTGAGYIELGPGNTSHCHIQTDRSNFYFNKELRVDSGIVGSYDEDLQLRRANNSSQQMVITTTAVTTPLNFDAAGYVEGANFKVNTTEVIDTNRVLKNITRADFANYTVTGTSTTSPSYLRYANISANVEGSHMSHPYFFNDLANFAARGGTVTIGGLNATPAMTKPFDASPDFAGWGASNYTGSTMTITLTSLPKTLNYGGYIGIAFGNTGWAPASCKIEISTDGGSTWTTRLNDSSKKEIYFTTTNVGASGVNAIRFTLGQPTSSLRLTNIWAYNYNSAGMEEYFLSKGGGRVWGDVAIGSNVEAGSKLKLYNNGNTKMTIECNDSSSAYINFTGVSNEMSLGYDRANSRMAFTNHDTLGSNIRMIIKSGGDWVVSNTDARVTTQFSDQAGIGWYETNQNMQVATTSTSNPAIEVGLNHSTSNAPFINFRKQGTLRGSISLEGNDSLIIQSTGSTGAGLRFHPSSGAISPIRNGSLSNETISLGTLTQSFNTAFVKKAYFHGGKNPQSGTWGGDPFVIVGGFESSGNHDHASDQMQGFPLGVVSIGNNGGNSAAMRKNQVWTTGGVSGQAYNSSARWDLGRWEDNSTNSRSRLDLYLADQSHSWYLASSWKVDGGSPRLGIGITAPEDTLHVNGGSYATYFTGAAASDKNRYRFYGTSTSYTIGMVSGLTFGGLGGWGMAFNFSNNAERGFVWKDDGHGLNGGAMAVTTNGKLTVAHSARIGYGETDTTTPGTYRLDVSGNANFAASASDQSSANDSTSVPSGGSAVIRLNGGYTDGRYATEFVKVDRIGNLPLYIRESTGTANSFSNVARFGAHSNSGDSTRTNKFYVFGNMGASGTLNISGTSNLASVNGTYFSDGYVQWTAAQFNRYGSNVEFQYNGTSGSKVRFGANGSNLSEIDCNSGHFTIGAGITATSAGVSYFATSLTNDEDWENSPISIRERGMVGSAQTADKYAPNINFHWGGRFSKSIWINSNDFWFGEYSSTGVPQTSAGQLSYIHSAGYAVGTTTVIDNNRNATLRDITAAKTSGATIKITTSGSAGSVASKLPLHLDFDGYGNTTMARIRSWDESQSTADGFLEFYTNNYTGSHSLNRVLLLDNEKKATFFGVLATGTSPAANGTGDLKIIPTLNTAGGVGYAGQVIGVNIEDTINSSNQPEQLSTWGGVTGSTAIALQSDDNTYGQFQVWTAPQNTAAGTALTPRFWIAGNGNATFANGLGTLGTISASTAGSSIKAPLYIAEQNSSGEGGEITLNGSNGNTSHTLDTVNGTFRIFDTNGTFITGNSGYGLNSINGYRVNGTQVIGSDRRIKAIAEGSESAPGLYFGSDTDTGLYAGTMTDVNALYVTSGGTQQQKWSNDVTRMYARVVLESTGNATATTPNMISEQSTDSNGSTRYHINFTKANGSTVLGRITTNNYATTYTETSDYRLKENVNYTWTATDRLKQLRPCQYNWISDPDDTTVDGFLAHEVADVAPQAVVGEKDAVDSEGNIDAQGVDNSKLVPLLVKTIQELEARIAALENA